MKTQVAKAITMAGLLMTLGLGSLSAGSIRAIRADIPFDFIVNGVTMPAGQYTVSHVFDGGSLLIKGTNGESVRFVHSQFVDLRQPSEDSRISFFRYGNRYLLNEILTVGDSIGHLIPNLGMNRESMLADKSGPDEVIQISAR